MRPVLQVEVGDEVLPASLMRSESVAETVECGDGHTSLLGQMNAGEGGVGRDDLLCQLSGAT